MPLPIFDFGAARRLPQQPNPNAVRAYIRHLLTTKLDTTPKYAELVAKNWHLGQSRDLYEASAKHLSDLFGQDVGPILFRLVHEDIWEDWWNSYQGLLGSACLTVSVSLAVYSLIRACKASTWREARDGFRYFFAAAGPMMLASILLWPHGATRQLFMIISAFCTGLGALFGVIDLADKHTDPREKQT
ncbi:hypothetical protein KJ359_007802 [Pestalotiopsis sp. 9143b]|nr:hypothetical protein KJ359_007802 [Pestalotiopsis sp. 9143b]